jgi:hypothetical protein
VNKGLSGVPFGGTQFYQSTLEPMQMLAQYRAGMPVVNHVFRPAQQFLPQGLSNFDYGAQYRAQQAALKPPAPVPLTPVNMFAGGPGGDGSPGGVGTDGGADGSGGAGGGGGGGK